MGCILTVDIGGTSAKSAAIYPNGRFERLKGFATGVCMTRKELEEALYSVIQSCPEEPDDRTDASQQEESCPAVSAEDN